MFRETGAERAAGDFPARTYITVRHVEHREYRTHSTKGDTTLNLETKSYTPDEFVGLAARESNLRTAQIHQLLVARDGTHVVLKINPAGERIADKRATGPCEVEAGYLAVDAYERRNGQMNTEALTGTTGIDQSAILGQVLQGIGSLFNREGRCVLVCGQSANTTCYMRAAKTGKAWTNLTEAISAVEVAYVPGAKIYLIRKGEGNQIGCLPIEAAADGSFTTDNWKFVAVPGAKAVTGIPPRVQSSRAVMAHIVDFQGSSATVALDLTEIGDGHITVPADAIAKTPAGLCFRGFVDGQTAAIQNNAGREIAGLQPGMSLVTTAVFERTFGPPARAVLATAAG